MNTFKDFTAHVIRTVTVDSIPRPHLEAFAVFGLGLTGEAGEVADLIKKHIGHGHPLDREKLIKELGDVLWYLTALALESGTSLEEIAYMNEEKLRKRYPNGFTHEASKDRTA